MSVAKVMGILSFTNVLQLYNGMELLRSYDGTTEASFGFRSGFNAVACVFQEQVGMTSDGNGAKSPSVHCNIHRPLHTSATLGSNIF